jgi:hypothetical protein
VVQTGASDGPPTLEGLNVQFTANFPAGFTYVLVPDPANGQFPIQSVLYANGANFLTNNFWITDRTFIGQGHPPLLETNLHLLVYHTNAGPDSFTLVYSPPTILTETNPPASAVFSLPAVSPQTFGVVWSGASYVGGAPVAYYDIYVSDNGGPFTDWQPQTTATGVLFTGVAGHTYAFYSVATDTAGHREATPVAPQAQTTVLRNTKPPTITLASTVTLTAGQTLSLGVIAIPGNPENTLTFSLGVGAPAGVVVNATSGQITWATSPAFAGTTNCLSVIATDNGQPPLSATGTVAVIVSPVVQRTNTPPSLPTIANRTVSVGSSLVITNQAADTNIPAVTLTYTLLNAPAGAGINPTNGRITWTPAPRQGGTTNLFTEAVTDNGAPPLSAYQSFVVTVPDYLSLSLGGTALLSGHNGAVPLTLLSTEPITNLVFTLQYPQNVLTNWALTNAVAQLATGRVAQLSATQSLVSLASLTGQTYAGTSAVAQLSFTTIANPHSQIVPLQIANAIATTAQGQTVTNINVQTQPLVLIGAEPLLQGGLATNGARLLTLYGKPGSSYMVEWSTNLAKGWQAGWRTPLTNVAQGYAGVGTDGPDEFYRAYEFFANPPILMPALVTPTNLTLLVYGLKGSNYVVTVATNLAKPNNWTPAASFTLTNSYQYLNPGAPTNPAGFFRVERP